MTVAAPPREEFKLGMLWSDSRYRAITIQVIALIAIAAFVAWIVSNTIRNLELLGVETGFDFLWLPASYDINQTLIDYDSRSPHWRAAVVGILNTLLVAGCGVVAATLIGIVAGVLRLSKNWLIAKLMTVYVEATRNVPLLLQILLWYGIFIHTLPSPRAATPALDGALVATNRGVTIPAPVAHDGLGIVGLVLLASIVVMILFRYIAKKHQERTGQTYPVFLINLGILIIPAGITFIALGAPMSFEYPELRGFNFRGGMTLNLPFLALWFALSLYTGAFIAEIVRAGILSVNKGQTEAASALGLRANKVMSLVVLPQALRVIVPPLISQYLNLTKNSSLAIAVGYMDVTGTLGGITLNQTGRALECILLLMAFYLSVSLTISMVMNVYDRSVRLRER